MSKYVLYDVNHADKSAGIKTINLQTPVQTEIEVI